MSEEEKKAIENLKEVVDLYNDECLITTDYDLKCIEILLNLIKKQSEEIEKLKGKNKTLETLLQGKLYELYLYYKELCNSYQASSISKDKIKRKNKRI